MCWEDVLYGRKLKSIYNVTGTNLDIKANARRVGFWIGAESLAVAQVILLVNGTAQIFFQTEVTNTGMGIGTGATMWVGIEQLGDLMMGPLQLVSLVGGLAWLIEVYADDDKGKLNTAFRK